jgi:hypothetical protein
MCRCAANAPPLGEEVECEVELEEDRGRGKLEIEAKWRQAARQ